MAMYVPRHFAVSELVPPEIFAEWKASPESLLYIFDVGALQTLDGLRDRYGPLVVNNWHQGGAFRYSGWRPFACTEGAPLSQHKFGRAFDCKFRFVTADEVREDIFTTPDDSPFFRIRRVEVFEGMSWFHFDMGNHLRESLGVHSIGRA